MVTTRSSAAAVAKELGAQEEADSAEYSDNETENETETTLDDFLEEGAEIMRRSPPSLLKSKKETTTATFEGRWTSHFNAEPKVCLDLWNRLQQTSFDGIDDANEQPRHLLWACLFLQVYAVENVLAGMCECDEETFKLYAMRFVEKISYLEFDVVSYCWSSADGRRRAVCSYRYCRSSLTALLRLQIIWENRFNDDVGNKCKVTVDGVDCLAEGSGKAFYSHKFKKAAFRYELGVCIRTGDIVLIHGPFPPGDWPDLNIFRDAIKEALELGECVEADDGYRAEDPACVRAPSAPRFMEDKWWHKKRGKGRKRHETVNERVKEYGVLTIRFRHDYEKHSMCFRACAVLTQLSFDYGKRSPFEVRNYDEKWADRSRAPLPGDIIPGDEEYSSDEGSIS